MVIIVSVGCKTKDDMYTNPPQNVVDRVAAILPAAEQFVLKNEAEALRKGSPLNSEQLLIASRVQLKHPEKVRLYHVDQLPSPQDPMLAQLAKQYGYSSPHMAAYTFGYGIWIKNTEKDNKLLLSHELIHVRQAEQLGIKEQIRQYLIQLFIYGYDQAPMEQEAYREASSHI